LSFASINLVGYSIAEEYYYTHIVIIISLSFLTANAIIFVFLLHAPFVHFEFSYLAIFEGFFLETIDFCFFINQKFSPKNHTPKSLSRDNLYPCRLLLNNDRLLADNFRRGRRHGVRPGGKIKSHT